MLAISAPSSLIRVCSKDDQPVIGDANVRFTLHPRTIFPIPRIPHSQAQSPNRSRASKMRFLHRFARLWHRDPQQPIPVARSRSRKPCWLGVREGGAARSSRSRRRRGIALYANSVAWSGITGIPDKVLAPVQAFYRNVRQTAASGLPAGHHVAELVAVVHVCCGSGGRELVEPRLLQRHQHGIHRAVSHRLDPQRADHVFFNQNGVHYTISGNAIINVPAGVQTCDIVVTRDGGSGFFQLDTNDSLSYTITNIKQ